MRIDFGGYSAHPLGTEGEPVNDSTRVGLQFPADEFSSD
jgi:hypothetical protein